MLELRGIDKSYGDVQALAGIDLAVEPGEILALAGPSGAGKTTTLHIAAGVLAPDAGEVRIDGADVVDIPAWKRDVALVQESYALYPHMTVFNNIAFPLRAPHAREQIDEAEIRRRVVEVAELLAMDSLLENRIQHLSGGQRQRVALGRALVRQPRALLLDEPIAHLDAKLRHWLRGEVRRLLKAAGRPCIWATPDGKEGLSVADRVAVIIDGAIVQSGTPREVFSRPATARAAEILSEPPISILPGTVGFPGPELYLDGVPTPLRLSIGSGPIDQGPVLVGIRARGLKMLNSGHSPTAGPAQVLEREFTTRETVVSVKIGSGQVRVLAPPFTDFQPNEHVTIEWEGAHVYLFEGGGDRKLICEAEVAAAGSLKSVG